MMRDAAVETMATSDMDDQANGLKDDTPNDTGPDDIVIVDSQDDGESVSVRLKTVGNK